MANTGGLAKGLTKSRGAVKAFATAATASLAAVASAGVVATRTWRQVAPVIDKISKTADRLGVSTEALSALHHAAELSGVGANTADMAFQRFTRRLAEAARGGGEAKAALAELGISAQAINGLPLDKKLGIVADRLKGVGSQSDRVRLAFKLFDSEGVKLLDMLQNGSGALSNMTDDARRLGITFDRDAAAGVEAANDALTRVDAAVKGLKTRLVISLAPAVEQVSNAFADWVANMNAAEKVGSSASSSLSSGWGQVADVAEAVKLGFLGARHAITKTIAMTVEGMRQLSNATADALNSLPGIQVEQSGFLNAAADELARASAETGAAFREASLQKPPSERLRESAGRSSPIGEPTAAAAVEPTASVQSFTMPPEMKSFLQRIGAIETPKLSGPFDSIMQRIGGGLAGASNAIAGAGGMAGRQLATLGATGSQTMEARRLEFAEMGSREAFDAVRRHQGGRSENRGKGVEAVAKNTQTTNTILTQLVAAVKNGTGGLGEGIEIIQHSLN